MTELQKHIENLYLEYVNDFLTVEKFAEYHEISVEYATSIIEEGRRINREKTNT